MISKVGQVSQKSAASTSPWKQCPLDKLCFQEPHHHSISFPLPLHHYLLDPSNVFSNLDKGVHQSMSYIKCLPSPKQEDNYFIVPEYPKKPSICFYLDPGSRYVSTMLYVSIGIYMVSNRFFTKQLLIFVYDASSCNMINYIILKLNSFIPCNKVLTSLTIHSMLGTKKRLNLSVPPIRDPLKLQKPWLTPGCTS